MFFLQGCSHDSNQTSRLNVALTNRPISFDPRKADDLFSIQIQSLLYRGLFKEDKNGNIILDLVKSYSICRGNTIVIKLKDALWSDGKKITASDFEKNIKEALSPNFTSSNVFPLYIIKNAKKYKSGKVSENEVKVFAKSENTLVIEFEEKNKDITKLLTPLVFSPYRQDAYSGPYYTYEYNQSFLTLKKNPKYKLQDEFSPQIIKFLFINDNNLCTQMFLNGELDIIGYPYSAIPASYKLHLNNKYRSYKKDVLGVKLLNFNCMGTFKNKRLRKAFSRAINREDIVKNITQQAEKIVDQPISGFSLNELELLKKPITLIYANDENNHLIAQHIQRQLASNLKIKIHLRKIELSTLWQKLNKKEYDICLISWFADYPEYENIFERLKINNHYKNYTGYSTNILFKNSKQLLKEDLPVFPLFQWNFQIFTQNKIKNLQINSSGIVQLDKVVINKGK